LAFYGIGDYVKKVAGTASCVVVFRSCLLVSYWKSWAKEFPHFSLVLDSRYKERYKQPKRRPI
jgi:hypothetical protein